MSRLSFWLLEMQDKDVVSPLELGRKQTPKHWGVAIKGRKRWDTWIQPCLKLPRAVPTLFSYMSQTSEILPLAIQKNPED